MYQQNLEQFAIAKTFELYISKLEFLITQKNFTQKSDFLHNLDQESSDTQLQIIAKNMELDLYNLQNFFDYQRQKQAHIFINKLKRQHQQYYKQQHEEIMQKRYYQKFQKKYNMIATKKSDNEKEIREKLYYLKQLLQ